MRKKDWTITEFEDLKKYESQMKDDKVAPLNYERKEFILNNYLLANEFKNKIFLFIAWL